MSEWAIKNGLNWCVNTASALAKTSDWSARMDYSRICAIDGCNKPAAVRGWCNAHYHRWQRYASPLGGGPPLADKGAPMRFLLETALPYTGKDCLRWPFANTNGKSRLKVNGRMLSASRMLCEMVNGAAPTPQHHAAHKCGKGHEACVNPNHLVWKTPKANNADKLAHGTRQVGARHGLVKLTDEQVREIRRARGIVTGRALAKQFGISAAQVSAIQLRKAWAWL